MSLHARLTAPGPKRILALDGGGIRGAVSLGYLVRIEELLRERYGRPDLRLRDYFDLIGGTSVGSIIAAALAIGMEATEMRGIVEEMGASIFGKKRRLLKAASARYDATPLRSQLRDLFGDITLGSPEIGTGLCVVAKRADTRSVWPMVNHPDAYYYGTNSKYLLREVVRASTAAPTYFEAEGIELGGGETGVFVDGGVSMANNPAFQVFLVATLDGFPFHWDTGADDLLLVSVGTGTWADRSPIRSVQKRKAWNWAVEVPRMLMEDASTQVQLVLQLLGRSLNPWEIDSEIGDLSGDQLGPEPFLTYVRYDVQLDDLGLNALGLPHLRPKVDSLRQMSVGENVHDLLDIGERAAASVTPAHFPAAFDLR